MGLNMDGGVMTGNIHNNGCVPCDIVPSVCSMHSLFIAFLNIVTTADMVIGMTGII